MFSSILIFFGIFLPTFAAQIGNKTVILAENDETRISLLLSGAPILKAQTHVFKRQLFSSLQVIDMGQLALLKSNILKQAKRYESLTIFNVNGKFFSRKDLSSEYMFTPKLNYQSCKHLCLSKDSQIVSTVSHILDLQKYIPRNKNTFWINTHQIAQQAKEWNAEYHILFDNINIDLQPNALNGSCPKYFFLNQRQNLEQINGKNLAPMLQYYDSIQKKYWTKTYPELQVQMDLLGNISVLYPPPPNSLTQQNYLSTCICARDLKANYFKLLKAQKIARDALLLVSNLPLKLESNRLQYHNDKSQNISLSSILFSNSSGTPFIAKFSRLKKIYFPTQETSDIYDINHLQRLIQYLALLKNVPQNTSEFTFDLNISPQPLKLQIDSNITERVRNKRLSLQILHSLPVNKVFTKIVKIGTPFLWKKFKPFTLMKDIFQDYFDLRKNQPKIQLYASTNFSDPDPLKLEKENHIFNLTLKEKFDSLNSMSNPNLYHATELYRASFLLDYTYRRIMNNLPIQIFQNLKKSLNLQVHDVKSKITQKGSLLLLHYIFDTDLPEKKVENFHFRSLPFAKKDNVILKYNLPANYSPAFEPYLYDNCIKSLVQNMNNKISLDCPVTEFQNSNFVTYLYSYIDREFLLLKGPANLKFKCKDNPSRYIQVHNDYALLALGGGCHIEASHKNLKGQYSVSPSIKSFAYFEILFQYNLHKNWSPLDYIYLGIIIFALLALSGLVFAVLICSFGLNIKTQFDSLFSHFVDKFESGNDEDNCLPAPQTPPAVGQ